MEENNRESRIESLKKKLYSNNQNLIQKKKDGTFSQKDFGVGSEWKEQSSQTPKKTKKIDFRSHSSIFKKFFIGALVFLFVGVIYAFFMLYAGGNTVSTERVKISISGNAFTAGGEELPIDVKVKNENSVSIDSADLVIEYPRGSNTDDAGDYERKRISVKSISPGEEISERISVVLYGEQGTTKDIRARLEYVVRGSIATFTKEEVFTIQINTAPLVLSVDSPNESVSNQEFEFKIKAIVASTHLGENVIVRADYPPGFQFISASPNPILGNNIFLLQKKDVGAENTITIRGKIVGIDGDKKAFRISAGESDPKDQTRIAVVYNNVANEILLGRPFIDAKLVLNGSDAEVFSINSAEKIESKIEWSNNLQTAVSDIQIRAMLSGNALNKSSIQSNGFYDSNTNSVVWDKNTISDLAQVQPGAKGTLSLRFASLSLISGSNSVIADPIITVEISVKGSQPDQGVSVKEVTSFEKKDFRVTTDLQLTGETLYSTGPMTNSGPLPPSAGNETTYTVKWQITNTSNKASKGEVRATLPVNVTFVKKDPSSSEDLTYNDTTREIIWNAGNISRGAGFSAQARTVYFQIKLKPSTSQVGLRPNLLNESIFTANDVFSGASIRKATIKLNTLVNEQGLPPNFDRVVQ